MQELATFGSWTNTETFVVYIWLATDDNGRKLLAGVKAYPGTTQEKASELWWRLDRVLPQLCSKDKPDPGHDLIANLLTISLSRVDAVQILRRM